MQIGYPSFDQEAHVVKLGKSAKQAIRPVANGAEIMAIRDLAERVYVHDMIVDYIVQIVTATRNHHEIQVGASPRGSIALQSLVKSYALYQGRDYVLPDDVKRLASYVLCHRISLMQEAKIEGRTAEDVIQSILGSIAVPTADAARHGADSARSGRQAATWQQERL